MLTKTLIPLGLAAALAVPAAAGAFSHVAPKKPLVSLTVVVKGPGKVTSKPTGISCPGKCKASFPAGTKVTLTEHETVASQFDRWTTTCTQAGVGFCSFTMTKAKTVVASFRKVAAGGGGGTTTPPPAPTPAPTPPPPAFADGHYVGTTAQGAAIGFDVGGGQVANFNVPVLNLSCSPGGRGYYQAFTEPSLGPLTSDGSFSYTVTWPFKGGDNGLADGTQQFNAAGKVTGTTAAGTLAIGFTSNYGGFAIQCSSGTIAWTAAHS
jgi:hypothetical protein